MRRNAIPQLPPPRLNGIAFHLFAPHLALDACGLITHGKSCVRNDLAVSQDNTQEASPDSQAEAHALARQRLLTENQLGVQPEGVIRASTLRRGQLKPNGFWERVPMGSW